MNVAAVLALLLNSGVCGATDFHLADGGALRVVVCPMVQPEAPSGTAEPAPLPHETSKEERQAMVGRR